jgi:NAD(P)-dependent dehydrogenase (short-subunit alcohol dehydrogenase family)
MKKDKTVLIIGASRGIGAALLREYARCGCRIVAASRGMTDLENEAAGALARGGDVHVLACDASLPGQVHETVREAHALLGDIDVLIYNAGIGSPQWMDSITAGSFAQVLAVNTVGLLAALEAAIPIFRERGRGVFVGVSSLADVRGYPGSAAYCASKAAATTLLEAARIELRRYGIDVLTVRPGFVRTAMTDKNEFRMPFLMEADDAARRIVKGVSRRKRLIQFPWPIAVATRLVRLLPDALFETLAGRARPG